MAWSEPVTFRRIRFIVHPKVVLHPISGLRSASPRALSEPGPHGLDCGVDRLDGSRERARSTARTYQAHPSQASVSAEQAGMATQTVSEPADELSAE